MMKQILKKFLFWGILLAAPITFVSLVLFYFNASLTSDRVIFIFKPVFETLSGRIVLIEQAEIHIGFKTRAEFSNVRFLNAGSAEAGMSPQPEATIARLFIQAGTFSLFAGSPEVDSLVVEGFSGKIGSDWLSGTTSLEWRTGDRSSDDDGSMMTLQIDKSDLRIKCFSVRESEFIYDNDSLGFSLHIDEYSQDLRIDAVALMNLLLVHGSVSGTVRSRTDDTRCRFSLYGRIQKNFDDGAVYLRGGVLTLDGESYPFTAVMQTEQTIDRLRIFFEAEREHVTEAIGLLPPEIRSWLFGENEKAQIRTELIYASGN